MKLKVVCAVLVSMLLLFTMLSTGTQKVKAQGATVVYVDPEINYAAAPSQSFSININIANVTDLYGYDFKLFWNTTILDCVSSDVNPHATSLWGSNWFKAKDEISENYNATHGRYWGAVVALYPALPFNGSTTLVTLTFSATRPGNCTLDLCAVAIMNSQGEPIEDWNYKDSPDDASAIIIPKPPDVAITNVAPRKTAVGQGHSMRINVTVENQGGYTVTSNVTAYANSTEIDTKEVNLTIGASTTITLTWNTTGFAIGEYVISANATIVPGETDTTDNTYTDGTVLVMLVEPTPHPAQAIWVEPGFVESIQIGDAFTVDVSINVTDPNPVASPPDGLFGFEYHFKWDATKLTLTNYTPHVPTEWGSFFVAIDEVGDYNATHKYHWYAVSALADPTTSPFTGVTSVCTYNFLATGIGNCTLDLQDTVLADDWGDPIPHSVEDAHVRIRRSAHDVAVVDVTPSETVAVQGSSVSINVTVENHGLNTETFNVTAFAQTTSIGRKEITLASGNSTTITFTWNTSGLVFGEYEIWAEASTVPGEIYTSDNTLFDGTVQVMPSVHDVAITDVRTSYSVAYSGENVSIYVDAWNKGAFPETFNVTVSADENTSVIGDEVIIGIQLLFLPSGWQGFTTLTFTWNTTGVSPGNYTISAAASNVTQEADPTDNLYIDDEIRIFASIPCHDINITSPTHVELNPSIFQFNHALTVLEVSLGNMTIDSTGYEGLLRILGSTNNTIYLRVEEPQLEFADYYLPQNGSIKVPLWLLFDPGTYSGTYVLDLTVCGVHKLEITVDIVHIWVCQNGAYSVQGGTATFNWTVTGGSWIYLEAEAELPAGWSFTVDPPIGTLFETPHQILVNITAAPDAQEGDIGYVTLRAYKNATNILIWQYTFFASVDNQPPTIETIHPPTLTFTGDLLFNVTAKDASGIESIQLYYSINNGTWNNQTMQWSSGDTFNSTLYTLTLPHVPDDTTIQYYVVATDWLRNQTQSQVQMITVKYDIATTELSTEKTVLCQGYETLINVTIANEGTIPITSLKLNVYANTTLIHTQIIPVLPNGTATTITFLWNASDVPKGSYRITAFVIPVPDETDIADNTYTYSTFRVTMPGDIRPEYGIVDIYDLVYAGISYGSEKGKPPPSGTKPYEPNADINGDDIIDIFDIVIIGIHYGETYP